MQLNTMARYGSLLIALKDRDPEVRWRAARELGNLGPAASFAVWALVDALADEDVRVTAEWALARIGPTAVDPTIAALLSPETAVRASAVKILRNVPSGKIEMIVEALGRVLDDPEAEIRALAARSLGELGVEAQPSAEALMRALDDSKAEVRQASAAALGKVAEVELSVIERLTSHLSDGDREVRHSCVGALVTLAQRQRTRDFLMAVSRLEQLAKWGPVEDRALFRSAAVEVRVSVPARRSWPFRSSMEATPYEVLPRPAEAPAIDTESLPRVEGE